MSSKNLAISIKNLSKNYNVYKKPIDRIKQSFAGGNKKYFKEFCALDNVSFDLMKGETLGIVGRNGSGKSTLLQILYGTLSKTRGEVKVNGRVSALLELGAGFNSEFTGYENINVVGSLYGLTKEEIDYKLDEIIEFADIGDYIHQPVKTYSSGMFVRLAFSIAINVNPEILIIDEALAVGDIQFQSKCYNKIKDLVRLGTSIIFVTHDVGTVKALCDKCLYLKNGNLVKFGKSSEVVDLYLSDLMTENNKSLNETVQRGGNKSTFRLNKINKKIPLLAVTYQSEKNWKNVNRFGNGDATLLDVKIVNLKRAAVSDLEIDKKYIIQISLKINKNIPRLAVSFSFRDLKGQMLTGGVTTVSNSPIPKKIQVNDIWLVEAFFENKLKAGNYTLSAGLEIPIIDNQKHIFLDVVENAISFSSMQSTSNESIFHYFVKTDVSFEFFQIKR